MDIAALISSIGLSGTTRAFVGYEGVASDGTVSAEWGGTIFFQIDATANQIQTAALNQIKADAAAQMGRAVPSNARIKVLGV